MFIILQRLVFMIRYQFSPARPPFMNRKTLGNNDLNQVVASSGFSENKGLAGGSVSRAHKTWSRSSLFKDFLLNTVYGLS